MITPEQVQQAAALVQAAIADTARLRAWLASQPEDAQWDVLAPCGCPLYHFLHPIVEPLGMDTTIHNAVLWLDVPDRAIPAEMKYLEYSASSFYRRVQAAWDDAGKRKYQHGWEGYVAKEIWITRDAALAVLDRMLAERAV